MLDCQYVCITINLNLFFKKPSYFSQFQILRGTIFNWNCTERVQYLVPQLASSGTAVTGLFIFVFCSEFRSALLRHGGRRCFKGWRQSRGPRFQKWRPVWCCPAWLPMWRGVPVPHSSLGDARKEVSGISAVGLYEPCWTSEEPVECSPTFPKGWYLIFETVRRWYSALGTLLEWLEAWVGSFNIITRGLWWLRGECIAI